jgi:thiamine biosynthesis lipoprotein
VTAVEVRSLRRVEQVMGMPVSVDVREPGAAEAVDAVFAWLREVDRRFSTYDAASEISRLNRGELALADAHPDVRGVIDRCEELRIETRGYFDVRAASDAIDPSGLVKGWSVARAAAILDAHGWRNYAIDAGGDIVLRGGALPASSWRIGIRQPLLADRLAAVIDVSELAVATSAEYNRGQHVLDPHTRRPPDGILSVTVVGPDLGTADAYATAAFAMGVDAPGWTARLPRGYEAMTILADERVLFTSGFRRVGD